MPANLTPEYLAAERAFREARELPRKIEALEHMLRVIPKHKGTDRLRGDLKRKLAKLKAQAQSKKATASRGYEHHIDREGAGQVALLGLPNVGKSSLVARLTHARPEVTDYPYATRRPLAGMMHFEDVPIQLVDLPPIDEESMESWLPQMVRYADAALLLVDCQGRLLDGVDVVVHRLRDSKVQLVGKAPAQGLPAGHIAKRTLIAANKIDVPGALEDIEAFEELYGEAFRIVPISVATGLNLDMLGRALFELLEVLRVYTKSPGKKADLETPFICRRGATVLDLAAMIHKDIQHRFKHARLWNSEHEGQMVSREHALVDGDVVEIHV